MKIIILDSPTLIRPILRRIFGIKSKKRHR